MVCTWRRYVQLCLYDFRWHLFSDQKQQLLKIIWYEILKLWNDFRHYLWSDRAWRNSSGRAFWRKINLALNSDWLQQVKIAPPYILIVSPSNLQKVSDWDDKKLKSLQRKKYFDLTKTGMEQSLKILGASSKAARRSCLAAPSDLPKSGGGHPCPPASNMPVM